MQIFMHEFPYTQSSALEEKSSNFRVRELQVEKKKQKKVFASGDRKRLSTK